MSGEPLFASVRQVRQRLRLAELHRADRAGQRRRAGGQQPRHDPDRGAFRARRQPSRPRVRRRARRPGRPALLHQLRLAALRPGRDDLEREGYGEYRTLFDDTDDTRSQHDERKREKAILAGGCFWGMQDLIRKLPRRDLDPGRLHRRRRAERDLPQPRHARRGDRDHLRPGADLATGTCWSSSSRSTTRRRATGRATTSAPATGRRSSTRATSRSRSPRTRSPTSTPPACGRARSSPRSSPPGRSGRPSRSTRTTWRSYPNGYTCHFVRPGWKLPHRADTVSQ